MLSRRLWPLALQRSASDEKRELCVVPEVGPTKVVDRVALAAQPGQNYSQMERERERDLYFSMVTGRHYGTKTPPDQQPVCHTQGYNKTDIYLQYVSSMVSRVCFQV
jgi:hypothetical protein